MLDCFIRIELMEGIICVTMYLIGGPIQKVNIENKERGTNEITLKNSNIIIEGSG